MAKFWVVGGEYETTAFSSLAPGKSEVREGPFDSYDEALKCWQSHAWETVDNALAHFHIQEQSTGLPSAVDETQYWVIGGSFDTLNFENWSDATESHGPYLTYGEAEKKWQQLAWASVDDATARYRIETLQPSSTPKRDKLAYRCIIGPDDATFCERVSALLAQGYRLHGSPSIATRATGELVCAQALVLGD